MKSRLLALTLFAAGAAFAQFSVGIRIGAPPAPRVVRVEPRSPGSGYTFIPGYWYPAGNHYKWHAGYWTRPAYSGAVWVAPHHEGGMYYSGYWQGDQGQNGHSHKTDRDKHNRDYGYGRDRR
ncbi:MAG: YXWGXW repeat-containing protein [Candidatus Solibacter sp.]